MLRNRRNVIWGMFLMRGFVFWLMTLQVSCPVTKHTLVVHKLFFSVGSMHCFREPVNKLLLEGTVIFSGAILIPVRGGLVRELTLPVVAPLAA